MLPLVGSGAAPYEKIAIFKLKIIQRPIFTEMGTRERQRQRTKMEAEAGVETEAEAEVDFAMASCCSNTLYIQP